MRFIESDENLCMRGDALEEAIRDDIKLGLVPFWVSISPIHIPSFASPPRIAFSERYIKTILRGQFVQYNH